MSSYRRHLVPAKRSSHLVPLHLYAKNSCMVEFLPVEGLITSVCEPALSDCCRVLILRLIRMATEFIDCGWCIPALSPNHIKMDMNNDSMPKVLSTVKMVRCSDVAIDSFFASLAKGIRWCILAKYTTIPSEVDDLLDLMLHDAHKSIELINDAHALVPLENRREYFTRLHTDLFALKQESPSDYQKVLQGLQFPADWEAQIQSNRHLISMYNKRPPSYRGKAKSKGNGSGMGQLANAAAALNVTQTRKVNAAAPNATQSSKVQVKTAATSQVSQLHLGIPNVSANIVNAAAPNATQSSKVQVKTAATSQVSQLPLGIPNVSANTITANYAAKGLANTVPQKQMQQTKVNSTKNGQSSQHGASGLGTSSTSATTMATCATIPSGGNAAAQQPKWPTLKVGRYNSAGSDPAEEVVHYNRNCRVHGPEHGLSLLQVELMMKHIFSKVISSLQKSLQSIRKSPSLQAGSLMPTERGR